jgi:hypothetical protein
MAADRGKQNASSEKQKLKNFPDLKTVTTISGPWTVAFDPKWGGPEQIVFDKLDDWSQRPEPGLKHYSGKATYHTTFDIPPSPHSDSSIPHSAFRIPHSNLSALRAPHSALSLSLGSVQVMASVRLNGRELGTVWCVPWRVEVPGGVIREKNNTLEITVANLWINRLIGDAALPPEQRLAWTTWNPYKPNSPLHPSGLLGPVTVEVTE